MLGMFLRSWALWFFLLFLNLVPHGYHFLYIMDGSSSVWLRKKIELNILTFDLKKNINLNILTFDIEKKNMFCSTCILDKCSTYNGHPIYFSWHFSRSDDWNWSTISSSPIQVSFFMSSLKHAREIIRAQYISLKRGRR